MKIFKRMIPIILVFFFFVALLSSLILYSFYQIQATTQRLIVSRRIVEDTFNLSYLTQDYLANPSQRIKFQWDVTYLKFRRGTNELEKESLSPRAKNLVEKITDKGLSAKHYFSLIAFSMEEETGLLTDSGRKDLGRAISVDLHQMASSVFTLENIFREEFLVVQRRVGIWFLGIIFIFFLVFIGFIYRLFREIRYRAESQKKLSEVNEKLRLVDRLVEFTGDGAYRYNYDEGVILSANQGFADILELGCSYKDLIGKQLEDVLCYLEEPGTIRKLIEKKGSIRAYPYHFKTLSGKNKWVLHNSFLVKDRNGKKIIEAIITDITEKRKIEQKSRFLAGILDSAPLSVIATDQKRKIIYVNPATEKLFGYSQDELIGKDPMILNAEPDREEIEDEIVGILKKGGVYTRRLTDRKKDGSLFKVEMTIYQLKDKKGNFIALVGFQKDVTQEIKIQEEIRESEIKFRNIFEKAGSAIFVSDPETGNILDCNRQAEKLMGMPREELVGIHQSQLHPEADKERYKKVFKEHIEKGAGNFQGKIRDKEGKDKPVWINAKLFVFGEKKLLVGFFTDLSQRFELERKEKEVIKASVKADTEQAKAQELEKAYNQLKATQDRLVEAEKLAALGKLSGIVAHDLRNPLAVIRNSVYILRKNFAGSKDSTVIKYLQLLDEEIEVADSIIEEVLSFTRIKNIKLSSFDLNEIIDKVLTKVTIPDSIRIEKKFNSNIPKMQADKEQLQRLFTNIIRNAKEAMEGQEGKLTLKTDCKDKTVLVEVSDTGIGINEDNAGKIFEPMYSTKIQGTGLGLPACKNIIEAHKGSIYVESKEGEGTTISVVLPLSPGSGD